MGGRLGGWWGGDDGEMFGKLEEEMVGWEMEGGGEGGEEEMGEEWLEGLVFVFFFCFFFGFVIVIMIIY